MYVSVKTAGAIAITAAEGGIGYWSQIETYDWQAIAEMKARPDTFYVIRVINDNEDGYDIHPYAIDTELIQRGVDLFLTGHIRYGDGDPESIRGQYNWKSRPFADMDDLSAMDSDEADIVIQLGLFGKLIYG